MAMDACAPTTVARSLSSKAKKRRWLRSLSARRDRKHGCALRKTPARAQPADLVPQLRLLRRRRRGRVALLRVLEVVVHEEPELVAGVVEGKGEEDAAAPDPERVEARVPRGRDHAPVRRGGRAALELLHGDDVRAAREERDAVDAEVHAVGGRARLVFGRGDVAGVRVVAGYQSKVAEADAALDDDVGAARGDGDVEAVERLRAEAAGPPEPDVVRVDGQRHRRRAGLEDDVRGRGRAPGRAQRDFRGRAAVRGDVDADVDAEAAVATVREARRRVGAFVGDRRGDVVDDDARRRREVDLLPYSLGEGVGPVEERAAVGRPVPAARAGHEAAADVLARRERDLDDVRRSQEVVRGVPQVEGVAQELVRRGADDDAVDGDDRVHLHALEDERRARRGGAGEGRFVGPRGLVPKGLALEEGVLVERVADDVVTFEVADEVAGHGDLAQGEARGARRRPVCDRCDLRRADGWLGRLRQCSGEQEPPRDAHRSRKHGLPNGLLETSSRRARSMLKFNIKPP